mmetsp:Transcript_22003/g.70868  ORF Transcript_22003/g.70868 Transcript_22003/m.70868 type:complete len:257 (-) Transcript_22003:465-1235(-)
MGAPRSARRAGPTGSASRKAPWRPSRTPSPTRASTSSSSPRGPTPRTPASPWSASSRPSPAPSPSPSPSATTHPASPSGPTSASSAEATRRTSNSSSRSSASPNVPCDRRGVSLLPSLPSRSRELSRSYVRQTQTTKSVSDATERRPIIKDEPLLTRPINLFTSGRRSLVRSFDLVRSLVRSIALQRSSTKFVPQQLAPSYSLEYSSAISSLRISLSSRRSSLTSSPRRVSLTKKQSTFIMTISSAPRTTPQRTFE